MKHFLLFAAALGCVACANPDPTNTAQPLQRDDTPLAANAEPEASDEARDPQTPPLTAGADVTPAGIRLQAAQCESAEDGQGGLVQPLDCVHLIASANQWPARALDPVLHLGQLHFHQYQYGEPGELIFRADRALLPPRSDAFVQYGDDPDARYPLTNRLEVSR